MKRYALIVAGGQGTRMMSTLPKQFLVVNDKPILMHTMHCFEDADVAIVLVLNSEYHNYWKELCLEYNFTLPHQIVGGGTTRAQSVLNGLKHIDNESLVAIHDAVRPLVSPSLIEKLFVAAAQFGNAIPVVGVKESMREVIGSSSVAIDRKKYRLVQTPQCFKTAELMVAFQHPDYASFTDEASLYQQTNHQIHLEEGEHSNIKITFPEDILFAAAILGKQPNE